MNAKRIIIVDDEVYVTATLGAKFRKAGYEVVAASNGAEAFELAAQVPPDLIVTDYQMPELSGFEMSVKLKADSRTTDVPIVMLTARGHHLSPEQLTLTNIKVLLSKPFSALELLGKVNEILGRAQVAAANGVAGL